MLLTNPASGSTFPYIGRHQQLHLLASVTNLVVPATEPNSIITITVGNSLRVEKHNKEATATVIMLFTINGVIPCRNIGCCSKSWVPLLVPCEIILIVSL